MDARLQLFLDANEAALCQVPDERSFSESEILELLTQQVAYLLDKRRDWLLGKLYRLDVREEDIQVVLHSPQADIARGLAQLIMQRQAERQQARERYASPPIEDNDLEGMQW